MKNPIINPVMKAFRGFKFTVCGQSAKAVKISERDGSISLSVSVKLFSRQLEDGTWEDIDTWVSLKAARGEHHEAVVKALRDAVADGTSAYIIAHGLLLAYPYLSRNGTPELAYTMSVSRPEHLKVYKSDGQRSAWRVAADDLLPPDWPFAPRPQGVASGEDYFESKARSSGVSENNAGTMSGAAEAEDDIPF